MKYLLQIVLLVCYTTSSVGQIPLSTIDPRIAKPPLDVSTFEKWLYIDGKPAISNNGKYAFYFVREHSSKPATLIVQEVEEKWKIVFPNVDNAVFSQDSRKIIFSKPTDSLLILTLGSASVTCIPHVKSFKSFGENRSEWLIYELDTPHKKLILRNLQTGREQLFSGVSTYLLSKDGNTLVLGIESKEDTVNTTSLCWLNISSGNHKIIFKGKNIDNITLDDSGTQLAFMVEDNKNKTCWYHNIETGKSIQLAYNQSSAIDTNLKVDRITAFSKDGKKLFVSLKENLAAPSPNAVKVDIWSYFDAKLQSQQLNELAPRSYIAVIDINDHTILRLQQEDDIVKVQTDSFLYIVNIKGDTQESHWSTAAQKLSYIISVNTGERKLLQNNKGIIFQQLSPNGKYLIGKDDGASDFYSYELSAGITRNITRSLPVPLTDMLCKDNDDYPISEKSRGLLLAGWLTNGEDMLIYDDFDIWWVHPAGRKPPINVTNGYGRKNQVRFRLSNIYLKKPIPNNKSLILNAFDKKNKNSGFYRITLGKKNDPELLNMGPYQYHQYYFGYPGSIQLKARDVAIYLVKRESAEKSPNLYWTKDFRIFTALSAVCPEKAFNWYTSTLMNFTTLDGRIEQGVLYRPEDFDPRNKYPVIIFIYERKSQNLNNYYKPYSEIGGGGDLDIAWFVSNGYMVFTPDIHYTIGETGQSASNSVIAAAKYLAKQPWVNSKRMGLQGHSFGGFEINYIVTRTNHFAAAVSSSGMSNFISDYFNSQTFHAFWYERGIGRLGATLWEAPDLYIKNSPTLQADKIATPVLIIANKRDGNVPFEQGLEFFMALRRLGKKAWMLQYDESSHGMDNAEDYRDYVIRMTQFFDHYLKDAPAPKWMLDGIPARLKGIENGLLLDATGRTPGPGLLIESKHFTMGQN